MSTQPEFIGGHFLIASPYLTDGSFFRRVVLMIRHEAEGAIGVVINQVGTTRYSDLVSTGQAAGPSQTPAPADASVDEMTPEGSSDQIYVGGPVSGPLLALHDIAGIGDPCSISSSGIATSDPNQPPGVSTTVHNHPAEPFGSLSIQWQDAPAWVTADEDHLHLLAARTDARVKFVVNYSGWGPGQLESELDAGGWLVTPADADSIFGDPGEIWERLVKRCGQTVMREMTGDHSLPDIDDAFDPGLN